MGHRRLDIKERTSDCNRELSQSAEQSHGTAHSSAGDRGMVKKAQTFASYYFKVSQVVSDLIYQQVHLMAECRRGAHLIQSGH